LVQVFTERFARELGKEIAAIPKETMKTLQEYDWFGNVRELENVVERAVILCQGPVLELADKLENQTVSLSSGLRTLEALENQREQRGGCNPGPPPQHIESQDAEARHPPP
jgi:DNA-binding NtrC family response regulator